MAGKTEWEDALIKHGIIAPPPPPGPTDDELALEWQEAQESKACVALCGVFEGDGEEIAERNSAAIDKLADKTLEELDIIAEDVDDDKMLEKYRAKRMAEMKEAMSKNKYGELTQISEKEFIPEVSKAPEDTFVICHLFIHSKPQCQLLNQCLSTFAKKFKMVKCVKIVAQEAIHNYPDSQCPTLLVYKKGDIVQNIVGLDLFGGLKMTAESLEWVLGKFGIVKTEIEDNPLPDPRTKVTNLSSFVGNKGRKSKDSDDEDENQSDDD